MLKHGGYWWPDTDEIAHKVIPGFAGLSMPGMHRFFGGRDTAIQAGGNVGLYPIYLSGHFRRVLTFEPELENFRCLRENCKPFPNIEYFKAALGDKSGTAGISRKPENSGSPRIEGGGSTHIRRIDDLQLTACDFIWLSVNGYNVKVLKGAEKTIAKFRPVIVLAESGEDSPDARNWLMVRNYEVSGFVPLRDYVMRPIIEVIGYDPGGAPRVYGRHAERETAMAMAVDEANRCIGRVGGHIDRWKFDVCQ